MSKKAFEFNIDASRPRKADDELLSSLEKYSRIVNFRYFTSREFSSWKKKQCSVKTIINRFGSWKKALKLIGIEGGHGRNYTPEELVDNLEKIWVKLGYPPSKGQISKLGAKISDKPYMRVWGSLRIACRFLAKYRAGQINREQLLQGDIQKSKRKTIPLKDRWAVLKRDNYRCRKCGASPAKNHNTELEIDHIIPISKGGINDIDNLQTLCRDCNQGKKDKEE